MFCKTYQSMSRKETWRLVGHDPSALVHVMSEMMTVKVIIYFEIEMNL